MPFDPQITSEQTTAADWKLQFQRAIRDPVELCERLRLPPEFKKGATLAAAQFPVFAPHSYVDRMQLADPDDPLLRQVLPLDAEMNHAAGFVADPVGDSLAKHQPGLIQKYQGRVLLITTGICAIHCRYCFRRHYPYATEPKSIEQWTPAIRHIAEDHSIHEVILSGGDPLSLSDGKLAELVAELGRIGHLRRLRIHTRLPIVIPDRVTDEMLHWLTSTHMQPIVVVHANHANELSSAVLAQIERLRCAGVTLLNQAVLLRGVNDNLFALEALCERLSDNGVLPYYLNQLDRVQGAAHFEVPVEKGEHLIELLRGRLPGYAVPRYVQEIAGSNGKTVLI